MADPKFATLVPGTPPLLSFMNLQTGKIVFVQFNPENFQHGVDVRWKDHEVPGLSHQPSHYISTKNDHIVFKLLFRARPEKGQAERQANMQTFNYLQSLTRPKRGATNITDAGPPRVLVVWPKLISMTCTVRRITTTFKKFASAGPDAGQPVFFEVDIEFHAISDLRITSDDVLANGLFRAGSTASGSTANQPDAISGAGASAGNSSGSNPPPVDTSGGAAFQSGRSPAQR